MALNIKVFFPRNHPQVSFPDDRKPIEASTSDDFIDEKKDKPKEEMMKSKVKNFFKKSKNLKDLLNIF